MEKEMTFSQAMEALYDGKKVTELDWKVQKSIETDDDGNIIKNEPRVTYLKMLKTDEKGNDIINQVFVAKFWYSGGYMPTPFIPSQYEFLCGRFVIVD